jgi:hypothetical protein
MLHSPIGDDNYETEEVLANNILSSSHEICVDTFEKRFSILSILFALITQEAEERKGASINKLKLRSSIGGILKRL